MLVGVVEMIMIDAHLVALKIDLIVVVVVMVPEKMDFEEEVNKDSIIIINHVLVFNSVVDKEVDQVANTFEKTKLNN